ncbi:MAG TPA: hypothetical protein VFQ61_32175 [Polyangiaceae bacterium]|nr:hypothetical protein [Polyangiaceae bacterium]
MIPAVSSIRRNWAAVDACAFERVLALFTSDDFRTFVALAIATTGTRSA